MNPNSRQAPPARHEPIPPRQVRTSGGAKRLRNIRVVRVIARYLLRHGDKTCDDSGSMKVPTQAPPAATESPARAQLQLEHLRRVRRQNGSEGIGQLRSGPRHSWTTHMV